MYARIGECGEWAILWGEGCGADVDSREAGGVDARSPRMGMPPSLSIRGLSWFWEVEILSDPSLWTTSQAQPEPEEGGKGVGWEGGGGGKARAEREARRGSGVEVVCV